MKQIYNIMVGMALMLGATSCEEEILDNGQAAGIALADGQFIVDYSGEVTTRAIKDNAAKGERINSLTYLLYIQQADDYVLQKRREIPGLDGNTESWPLTRDNMTWEQREALKDTLMVGSNYRAVFVANADASLWGGTSPLKEADFPTDESAAPSYSSAYLQLPEDLAFNDGNMFYLAEAEIDGAGKDRETPYNCRIMLKRVVTRTDWWFERLPEWIEESPENPSTGSNLPEVIKEYLNPLLIRMASDNYDYWAGQVVTSVSSFLDEVATIYDNLANSIVGVDGAELTDEQKAEKAKWKKYAEAMRTLKTQIVGTGKEVFLQYMFAVDEETGDSEFLNQILSYLFGYLNDNATLKSDWQKYDIRAYKTAKVSYKGNVVNDRYYLNNRWTADGYYTSSPSIAIDLEGSLDEGSEVTYKGFNWVGFSSSAEDWVSEIVLNGEASAEWEIPFTLSADQQGKNEQRVYSYHPVYRLNLKSGWTQTKDGIISCNMEEALPFDILTAGDSPAMSAEELEALKEDINVKMSGDNATITGFGSSLSDFSLPIELPDLSSMGCIECRIFMGRTIKR